MTPVHYHSHPKNHEVLAIESVENFAPKYFDAEVYTLYQNPPEIEHACSPDNNSAPVEQLVAEEENVKEIEIGQKTEREEDKIAEEIDTKRQDENTKWGEDKDSEVVTTEKREEIFGGSTDTYLGDALKNLLVAPLVFQPITFSNLILYFDKIDPFQNFQIGLSIQTSTKNDMFKEQKKKII